MASRSTRQEAEKVKAEFQASYPDATIRIIDNSKTMRIGRLVAQDKGYDIVEDDGGIMVTAEVTTFDILEVRTCACGNEILTAAIGELGLTECKSGKEQRRARQAAELADGIERNRTAVARHMAFDEYSEPAR